MSDKNEQEMITITKSEYERLLKHDRWLKCLDIAGVDNWNGYDYAFHVLDEMKEYDKKIRI